MFSNIFLGILSHIALLKGSVHIEVNFQVLKYWSFLTSLQIKPFKFTMAAKISNLNVIGMDVTKDPLLLLLYWACCLLPITFITLRDKTGSLNCGLTVLYIEFGVFVVLQFSVQLNLALRYLPSPSTYWLLSKAFTGCHISCCSKQTMQRPGMEDKWKNWLHKETLWFHNPL